MTILTCYPTEDPDDAHDWIRDEDKVLCLERGVELCPDHDGCPAPGPVRLPDDDEEA